MRFIKVAFVNWRPSDEYFSELSKELSEKGIKTDAIPLISEFHLSNLDPRALIEYDVVYFVNLFYPNDELYYLLRLSRTLETKPIVYGVHAPVVMPRFRGYRPRNYLYSMLSLLRLIVERTFINNQICSIHVLNSFDLQVFRALRFRRVAYIPWGIPNTILENCQPSPDEKQSDRFTIVFVGARYGKGADIAYSVISSLLPRFPDIHAKIFLGHGTLPALVQHLQNLADKFPNRVDIFHLLSRRDFLKELLQAHLLLFPSKYETFGLVVLEALACGTPVVAFDIPGAPRDLLKPAVSRGELCGHIAKNFDLKSLTRGVLKYYLLWKKDSSYVVPSISSRRLAERYPLTNMAMDLAKLFNEAALSCRSGCSC
ncbi:glycosyltransferase [Desulfurococcus mucosus]|uniref:glycosyltransferase n=1 Tax=Desulfurococcus mucosus TaxID=2275 RepID=UPI000AFD5E47|nr:glycosyltransferase [Desulfurococcus mucosus]